MFFPGRDRFQMLPRHSAPHWIGYKQIPIAYRSTSLPFGSIFHHDVIQILPRVELLPTGIYEAVDVVSQRGKGFNAPPLFDYTKK